MIFVYRQQVLEGNPDIPPTSPHVFHVSQVPGEGVCLGHKLALVSGFVVVCSTCVHEDLVGLMKDCGVCGCG